MNILIVAIDFKPNTGGIAEVTNNIAHYLHQTGDNVVVLSGKKEGSEDFDKLCPYGVCRCLYNQNGQNRIKRKLSHYWIIHHKAKQCNADVIVSNSLGRQAHICWLVSWVLDIPFCTFVHGGDINTKRPLKRKLQKIVALRGAKKVFCNSSATRDMVIKAGVKPHKTVLLHPGISMKKLRVINKESRFQVTTTMRLEGKKIVLTLGRLIKRKGIDKTIEAMRIVSQEIPNVVYVIAGDGPYRESLENKVSQLNLNEQVIFASYISEKDKSSYYRACDVFVMPNRELDNGDIEGFGIVFLEANAYGKPVIGGRSGGAIDAIINNETGLLVDPTNSQEIAEAIIRLLKDRDYARQLGNKGRKRVQEEFDWKVIVARMRIELVAVCI